MTALSTSTTVNPLTAGQLPRYATWVALAGSLLAGGVLDASLLGGFDPGTTLFVGALIYLLVIYLLSRAVEGTRRAADRLATNLVTGAFLLALLPLVSLLWETLSTGLPRFDLQFFSYSMRNVIGAGGGAVRALFCS